MSDKSIVFPSCEGKYGKVESVLLPELGIIIDLDKELIIRVEVGLGSSPPKPEFLDGRIDGNEE